MPPDVFRWIIAVAAVLFCMFQAIIVVVLYRVGKDARRHGEDASGRLGPLADRCESVLAAAGKILEENRLHIAEITAETAVLAKSARQQGERVAGLIDDTSARARARIAQIDHTVDQTVQQVEQAAGAVKGAVLKPVREVNGIAAGLKAAFNTYAQGGRHDSPDHVTQDEEMFI